MMVTLNGKNASYSFDPQDKSCILSEKPTFSKVFKGKENNNDKTVVIKQLLPELIKDELAVFRFKQEALLRFNHPCIVSVLDYINNEEGLFIITEYVEGKSLRDIFRNKKGKKNIPFILKSMLRLVEALEEIHKHNVIHCDIKPSNILITDENLPDIKLIDFGQAIVNNSFPASLSANHLFSFVYSAPEVILKKYHLLQPATDFFSLGITMYELIAGSIPFPSDNPLKLQTLQITYPVPEISGVQKEINSFIQKCCNKYIFPKPFHLYPPNELDDKLKQGIAGRFTTHSELKEKLNELLALFNRPKKKWYQF